MQVDMHYYGTYAIARAAGISQDAALRIAQAAQFVDDYTEDDDIETSDGALIAYWPTGHNLTADANIDLLNLEKADPHRVWVPFHFLPGGMGKTYKERMRCVKDSVTAKNAMRSILRRHTEPCFLELVGIMAHIYADTFSHYGFTGLRCDENKVDPQNISLNVQKKEIEKYLLDKAKGFFDKVAASTAAAATRGLGHASVADFPDRPYLRWSFTYESGEKSGNRDNQETFMDYCEKQFNFFLELKEAAPQYAEDGNKQNFDVLRPEITNILGYEAKAEERCSRWEEAARSLFNGEIPQYDKRVLDAELQAVKQHTAGEAISQRVWQFARAAELIRNSVSYELLPGQNIIA
jgi:hypothetical protein